MSLSPLAQSRLAAGAIRTTPFEGETTASWITRCAARYHLPPGPYFRAVLRQEGRTFVSGRSGLGTELYLNTAARERLAAYSRIEEQVLARVLPAWPLDLDVLRHHTGPAAHWQFPTTHTAAPVMAGCLKCIASRSRGVEVWQYRGWHQRVCRTHRIWLVGGERVDTGPAQIPLGEREAAGVLAAHRHHQALAARGEQVQAAWEWARGIIQRLYGDEELRPLPAAVAWDGRLDTLTGQAGRPGREWLWRIIARDLVTYPETLALTETLIAAGTGASEHQRATVEVQLTGTLAEVLRTHTGPGLTGEVEPLARWLARHARSELQRWLGSCGGDENAVPLHVPTLTWTLKRRSPDPA
ncbi:TniQ family protein [Streptomyces sp. NPDC006393]|uniref:TniQ family protein n=1 Tax=Streptomyces sp. NPDC006393 TaxID=3156763 RepID=UPI0034016C73